MGIRFLCFFSVKMDGKIIESLFVEILKDSLHFGGKESKCIEKVTPFEFYYFKVFVNVIHIIMNK